MPERDVPWWREAVIYQVYVRSFADTDGDGIGDLPGIRVPLPYLRRLGVDAIWLNPFYPSPQADAGYDVADYRDVDPLFGTLEDFDGLVADATARHPRDRRHRPQPHLERAPVVPGGAGRRPGSASGPLPVPRGAGGDGELPPNDWHSVFGGPAWTRGRRADGTPGQWYLHLFDTEQPDLDWTNPRSSRSSSRSCASGSTVGVDGFRIDVAHGLAKDPKMPDLGGRFARAGRLARGHPHWDQDAVHDVYRALAAGDRRVPGERVFVGEVWLHSTERSPLPAPGELHTAFNFDFLLAEWVGRVDARGDRRVDRRAMAEVGAPADMGAVEPRRHAPHDPLRRRRLGSAPRRARAATLLMLALPGAPTCTRVRSSGCPRCSTCRTRCVRTRCSSARRARRLGRDGCRVPLPWSGTEPPFGFGPGDSTWLPQPADWKSLTAEAQEGDPASMLSMYQAALRERRHHPALGTAR